MDSKDAPPPYPGVQELSNPVGQGAYSYPAQTNYGYSAQPIIQQQQQQQQQQNVVVTSGGWNQGPYGVPPQDYTTSAWLACLCCFWPTGLIAIMRATESRDALARGDMTGAHIAANSARQMIKVSFVVGVLSCIFATIFVIIWVVEVQNNLNYYDD